MFLHHLITAILLLYSDWVFMHPIGMLILLVHEPADIALYSSKASKHFGLDFVAVIWFVILLVTWFITRLVIYPRYLVYSVFEETWISLFDNPGLWPIRHVYVPFIVLLVSLTIFHAYWFYLILIIAGT